MQLRRVLTLLATLLCVCGALAQQPPVQSPLLDKLAGHWLLEGTLAGRPAAHDVDAEWVLAHHYLRIHEVSRNKGKDGAPDYEATIFIAWNDPPKQFSCVWLDVYGGLTVESIGVASPGENQLPFVFKDAKGETTFSNVFTYNPTDDTWEWHLDNIEHGLVKPFGRVRLTRVASRP